MNNLFAAIRFLTIIPVPGKLGTSTEDLAGSLYWFPLVGLLIGAVTGGLFYLAGPYLPLSLAVVMAVTLLLAFSGALHLDGVADCADGFFSSRPRSRMLEIMRDSHIGAMGVVALILVLAFKGAALVSIPPAKLWEPLLLMPVVGRGAMLVMMSVLPYARQEGGLPSVFYERASVFHAGWAVIFMLATGWLVAGLPGLLAATGSLLVLLLFCWFCHGKIGGATGDTLGAACEITEAAVAILHVCLLNWLPLALI
jgi:adenosylcobinamide-GDP ribazoletransferase